MTDSVTDSVTEPELDADLATVPDDAVEVRRDGPIAAVVGGLAAAVAVAYLLRAVGSSDAVDWALFVVTGLVGALHLAAFVDARAPLMVLDRHGVRVRRGRDWQGVAWPEVARVEHRPRRSLLADGELRVVTTDDRALAVRLSLSTRLIGCDWHELTGALDDLSDGRTAVVERLVDTPHPTTDPQLVEGPTTDPELVDGPTTDPEPVDGPTDPAPDDGTPAPGRLLARGRRREVVLERQRAEPPAAPTPMAPADRADAADDADRTTVVARDQTAVTTLPVVGAQLAAARARIGLSVDQLSERTRIRPHVIEAIEVDDFAPCGGDFYARGHLRTLARVLGVEAEPLLADYDERYADAPIDPRRVFEAELATGAGAPIRGTRGRLNWSVLVATVMAAVLVWSIARLVMDGPVPLSQTPVLNGSPSGPSARLAGNDAETVKVSFTTATGGARVIVRDGRQRVVFDEELAFMQTAALDVVPPVRISSTDGGLTVTLDGDDQGALGASGKQSQRVFVPER
ncbi:helix-turn-helix domain-containing protein [Nocardioides marinquilinus]|uniref:helix-turn-helix domain-containing protein n=1 Tax=Nocardioides marinquilinus TaxID=1210400 RepID=UPI0031EEBB7A